MPLTEADTCRKFVVPKLQEAGWSDQPHTINEQHTFIDSRIVFVGGKARRGKQKRADDVLRYRPELPIAAVDKNTADGPASKSCDMYFATYQSIASDESRPGLCQEYTVEECHRGSAHDDSNWREIQEWFQPATQIGMTATPRREDWGGWC